MAILKKNGFQVEVESVRRLIHLYKTDKEALPEWVKKELGVGILIFENSLLYNVDAVNSIVSNKDDNDVLVLFGLDEVKLLTDVELSDLFEDVAA